MTHSPLSIPGPERGPIRCLWPMLAPYSWQMAGFIVLGLLASLLEGLGIGLMIPLLRGSTPPAGPQSPFLEQIDRLVGLLPAESRMATLTALILTSILLKIVFAYAFTALAHGIRSRVQHDVRTGMFRQVLAVSQEYLDSRPGGSLLQTLTGGAQDTAVSVMCLLWLALSACSLLVFSTLLMAISWKLTLAIVLTLATVSKLVRLATGRVRSLGHSHENLAVDLIQKLKEALLGIRTIHAFAREKSEIDRFAAASLASHRLEVKRDLLVALAHPLSEGLAAIALMGLVFLALQAQVPLAVLATVVFMLLRLQPQAQAVNTQLAMIQSRHPAVAAVLNLLDHRDKPHLRAGTRGFSRLEHGIRFEQVSFAYRQGEREALRTLSFEIPRGETIAIVGPSGAGKSTLIHLLCRFYDPTGGRILVDGVDLTDLDPMAWRRHIALVSQDVHIFSTTVRENIAYGNSEASEAQIVAAAIRAHADEFIVALPQGYDTVVGDRGLLLSGGQRQRLSIARAILRDPDFLILDEATNALDSLSEARVQQSIEDIQRGRTSLVVAHRLSTIQRADRIVVLDQGQVVEQGPFTELLERAGLFAALYHSDRLDIIDLPRKDLDRLAAKP